MVILCLMVIQCPWDFGGTIKLFAMMCNWYSISFPLTLVIVFFIIDKARTCDIIDKSRMCCSPWGLKKSDMTEQLNWTEDVWSGV